MTEIATRTDMFSNLCLPTLPVGASKQTRAARIAEVETQTHRQTDTQTDTATSLAS